MDKKTLLISLEILLIILLFISRAAIEQRTNNFERDCRITYNVSQMCPCVPSPNGLNLRALNLSQLNYTKP